MMASDMAKYSRMILRGAVTALFLFAAFTKFRNPHSFAVWEYSDGFAIFIGIAELCGAIGLWIPRVSRPAALGLILIMFGAVYTQVRVGEMRQGVVPVVVLFALTRLALNKDPATGR